MCHEILNFSRKCVRLKTIVKLWLIIQWTRSVIRKYIHTDDDKMWSSLLLSLQEIGRGCVYICRRKEFDLEKDNMVIKGRYQGS